MTVTSRSTSLFWRNLLFTILQPGMVAGLIPWFIARRAFADTFAIPFGIGQYLGITITAIGAGITLHCIARFAIEGRGTLSPADPTRQLVLHGLYRFTRNPMYIGVTLTLVGEAVFTGSASLWIYSGSIFAVFNIYIIYWEEPRLRKDFGSSYEAYCRRVRRWL